MNQHEEQQQELEALSSIYPEELEVLSSEFPASFYVYVKSDDYDANKGVGICCCVKCSYSETYPETPLITEVRRDDDDLDDDDANELQKIMDAEANANVGMVHVFSVISKVQEQLNNFVDRVRQRKEAEKERQKFLEEEEERKKIEGTPVNVETFLAWKTKFDAEMRAKKKKTIEDPASKRPTGKQQFLLDATLSLSDVKLMEEGEVAIDESLFQDIDDLELDEEEKDEEKEEEES